MVMGLAGVLDQKPVPPDDQIISRMQGHLCRCCGYPNLVNAIRRAAEQARRSI
jgi:aerobic-type carbon monoxide dehydrogenase small subunit (CoxS/CutS family)